MSNTKLLVIIGVTGQQGGSVAKVFSTLPGWKIRGITRNPSKPSNASLREAGMELVAGDLDDLASLERAFDGAHAIFSNTDFWQFLADGSPTFAEAEKAGVAPNKLAMEKEIQQGKNIIDAVAKAHAKKPLHRFVVSNLSNSNKWSKGQIKHNLHFDGKAKYTEYLQATYPDLAKVSSYIQVGYYLTNFSMFPFWTPYKDPNTGDILLPQLKSPGGGKSVPFVLPPNDVGYFAQALIESPKSPAGTTMLGTCHLMPFEEFAELFGKTLGVKAKVKYISEEDIRAVGLPEFLVEEVGDSGKYVDIWGWDGGEPGVKLPEECGVDVSKLTDLGKWIGEQDWKF